MDQRTIEPPDQATEIRPDLVSITKAQRTRAENARAPHQSTAAASEDAPARGSCRLRAKNSAPDQRHRRPEAGRFRCVYRDTSVLLDTLSETVRSEDCVLATT